LNWIKKDDSPISHWFEKQLQKLIEIFNPAYAAINHPTRGHNKLWKPEGYDYKKRLEKIEEHLHFKKFKHPK
jgi:hypothetical protein